MIIIDKDERYKSIKCFPFTSRERIYLQNKLRIWQLKENWLMTPIDLVTQMVTDTCVWGIGVGFTGCTMIVLVMSGELLHYVLLDSHVSNRLLFKQCFKYNNDNSESRYSDHDDDGILVSFGLHDNQNNNDLHVDNNNYNTTGEWKQQELHQRDSKFIDDGAQLDDEMETEVELDPNEDNRTYSRKLAKLDNVKDNMPEYSFMVYGSDKTGRQSQEMSNNSMTKSHQSSTLYHFDYEGRHYHESANLSMNSPSHPNSFIDLPKNYIDSASKFKATLKTNSYITYGQQNKLSVIIPCIHSTYSNPIITPLITSIVSMANELSVFLTEHQNTSKQELNKQHLKFNLEIIVVDTTSNKDVTKIVNRLVNSWEKQNLLFRSELNTHITIKIIQSKPHEDLGLMFHEGVIKSDGNMLCFVPEESLLPSTFLLDIYLHLNTNFIKSSRFCFSSSSSLSSIEVGCFSMGLAETLDNSYDPLVMLSNWRSKYLNLPSFYNILFMHTQTYFQLGGFQLSSDLNKDYDNIAKKDFHENVITQNTLSKSKQQHQEHRKSKKPIPSQVKFHKSNNKHSSSSSLNKSSSTKSSSDHHSKTTSSCYTFFDFVHRFLHVHKGELTVIENEPVRYPLQCFLNMPILYKQSQLKSLSSSDSTSFSNINYHHHHHNGHSGGGKSTTRKNSQHKLNHGNENDGGCHFIRSSWYSSPKLGCILTRNLIENVKFVWHVWFNQDFILSLL